MTEKDNEDKSFVCLAQDLALGIILACLFVIWITTLVVSIVYYTKSNE